jgi:hypothetical protein
MYACGDNAKEKNLMAKFECMHESFLECWNHFEGMIPNLTDRLMCGNETDRLLQGTI